MRHFSVARATEASRRGSVLFGRSSVSDGAAADGSPPPRRPSRGRRFSTALSTTRAPTPRPRSMPPVAAATTARAPRSGRKSVTVTVPEETPSRAGPHEREGRRRRGEPGRRRGQPRKRAASRLAARVSTLAGGRRMSTMPSGAPSPPGARRPRDGRSCALRMVSRARRSPRRRRWRRSRRRGDVAGRAHVARRVEVRRAAQRPVRLSGDAKAAPRDPVG